MGVQFSSGVPDIGGVAQVDRAAVSQTAGCRIVPVRLHQTRDGSSAGSSAWLKPRRSKARNLPVAPFRSGSAQGFAATDPGSGTRNLPRWPSLQIAPVSRTKTQDRCNRTPGWTESHSHSYGLKEAQVLVYLDKLAPGDGCNLQAHWKRRRSTKPERDVQLIYGVPVNAEVMELAYIPASEAGF